MVKVKVTETSIFSSIIGNFENILNRTSTTLLNIFSNIPAYKTYTPNIYTQYGQINSREYVQIPSSKIYINMLN